MVEVKAKKMPQPWLVLNSRDEIGLAVMPGSPNEQVKLLKVSGHEAEMNALFGSGALESDYSLAQHMLETTPNDIHPMSSKREDLSRMIMLTLKSTILPSSANSGIFYIHTPEFRGFQFGDPAVAPKGIVVDLYSADGKMELVFSNKNHLITQPEINRVLQSLHKKAN